MRDSLFLNDEQLSDYVLKFPGLIFGEFIDPAFAFVDSVASCKLEQQESLTKNYGLSMSIALYDELILWEQMLEKPNLPTYFVP